MIKNEIISLPQDNKLHQGLIFTGAVAEEYSHCQVYGLIITARCDIAHSKVNLYNYLPIINMSDWIYVDFNSIILPKIINQIRNEMNNILTNMNLSNSILDTIPARVVYDKIIIDINNKKQRERYLYLLSQLDIIDALSVKFNKNKFLELINSNSKIRDAIINDLVKHKLNGYYYIPGIGSESIDTGYVVLLREINWLPNELATKMANGLSKAEYDYLVSKNKLYDNKMSFSNTDYVMPISQMKSPYIEHIMQCFGTTFCRIGVKDTDSEHIASIANHFIVHDMEAL
ncbi:hypothetical protein F6V30_00730 [Oryzomonas sagensis]|uniref:Uncharacterized protein n=1 Tax=Oryzomonas sagensis TaxID=2603857 RepID=A0ABQ6TQ54_9BACT|nr:hypothetical protein [Oryzomonas sagensis]KAB0671151.1 hypothetical protein F6V30_00730 [Oryzomonas sagensis]